MVDTIKTAGVLGLGVMGFDIAFLYAQKGYRTLVYDASDAAMQKLLDRRDQTIERLKKRDRISQAESESVKSRLIAASELAAMASADLLTEAVSESGKTKKMVYRALRESGFAGILTTNTSSLTRASLVGEGDYAAEKFATTHFFNPVLYTQMVEVVRGDMNDVGYIALMAFLADLGRKPVQTKDISGFVSNSILMVYAVMALRLIEAGASIEAVDGAAKELRVLPPCISFDSWKPSIVEDVTRVMFDARGDDYLRSSKLLKVLAKGNPLFYADRNPNAGIYDLVERGPGLEPSMLRLALLTSIRVAAARTVELGEAPATVDYVAIEGLKFPRGPLAEIDEIGAAALLNDLQQLNEAMPQGQLRAPGLLTIMAGERQTFFKDGQANPWIANFAAGRSPARH
jgi:3-hydroxybutyryl-CoA dehydrogenase